MKQINLLRNQLKTEKRSQRISKARSLIQKVGALNIFYCISILCVALSLITWQLIAQYESTYSPLGQGSLMSLKLFSVTCFYAVAALTLVTKNLVSRQIEIESAIVCQTIEDIREGRQPRRTHLRKKDHLVQVMDQIREFRTQTKEKAS